MGFAFNPFTGNFDAKGSGGGGSSYLDGEVQNFSALPETLGTPAVDSAYLVREAEGTWLLNRKPAGIYIRTANTGTRASDWTYAGEFPDVFSDANFVLYDNGDSTKNLQFQLSGIDTATTRTLTAPNASGTIALLSNFLSAVKDIVVLAPSADMTVSSTSTFADISGMSWTAPADTTYACICAWQIDCGNGGYKTQLVAPSIFQGAASRAGYGLGISGNNSLTTVLQGALDTELLTGSRSAAQTGPHWSCSIVRVGSTGGTAKFQFAQTNATGSSTLKAESRVILIPIA